MLWTPPSRPEWVTQLNAFGRQLGDAAAADTGLDPDETRALFADYQARHDIPSEP